MKGGKVKRRCVMGKTLPQLSLPFPSMMLNLNAKTSLPVFPMKSLTGLALNSNALSSFLCWASLLLSSSPFLLFCFSSVLLPLITEGEETRGEAKRNKAVQNKTRGKQKTIRLLPFMREWMKLWRHISWVSSPPLPSTPHPGVAPWKGTRVSSVPGVSIHLWYSRGRFVLLASLSLFGFCLGVDEMCVFVRPLQVVIRVLFQVFNRLSSKASSHGYLVQVIDSACWLDWNGYDLVSWTY